MGLLVSNPDLAKPCLCGQCLKLSVVFGGGSPYTITANPPPNLFNPSACCPGGNIWFISAGTGNQPGIFVDTSSNSSGQFTWTFTIGWGGNTVLTETGTITFGPSASFFIPFSDPNWKLNSPESGWVWYYSGTFNNVNPLIFGLHFNGDPKLNVTHWPGTTWYSCPSAVGFRIKP